MDACRVCGVEFFARANVCVVIITEAAHCVPMTFLCLSCCRELRDGNLRGGDKGMPIQHVDLRVLPRQKKSLFNMLTSEFSPDKLHIRNRVYWNEAILRISNETMNELTLVYAACLILI